MAERTPRVRDCRGNPFVRVRTKDWNGKPDRQGTPKRKEWEFRDNLFSLNQVISL